MAICACCGKGFSSKRSDAKYCSASCRSNASQKRKRAENNASLRTTNMFVADQAEKIRQKSPFAGKMITRLDALYGAKAAELAIEAIYDIFEACGGDWSIINEK